MDKETEKKKQREQKLREQLEKARREATELQDAIDAQRAEQIAKDAATLAKEEQIQKINEIAERLSLREQREKIKEIEQKLREQLQIFADTQARLRVEIKKAEARAKASKPEPRIAANTSEPEPRIFAKPVNSEDAEGEVPSAEVRAEGFNFKSQDEILKRGSLKEKIRLYICYLDADNYFGNESSLTAKELQAIANSIQTAEQHEEVRTYYREYETLNKFGENLRFYFKRFQASFAVLAKLLYQLDKYEEMIKYSNTILDIFFNIPSLEKVGKPPKGFPYYTTEEERLKACDAVTEKLIRGEKWDGVLAHFSREANRFELLHPKNGLLSRIRKESKIVTEHLSDFKAFAVVADDYCKKSKLKYLPISIQMCIENAEEERYIRYLVENLRYFRSELNYRANKGEKVSPQEYKLAVIPDYYEVKPSKDVLADCKAGINNIESNI